MNATDTTTRGSRQSAEREKWDNYYAALPSLELDDATRQFGEDLADRIIELLPDGGSVLEAGCGAGWQSLVLAQKSRLDVTLMDFSGEALRYAEQAFTQQSLQAKFVCQDVFAPGEPDYDLVFNAGVLEHYAFDEQVAFLRGMAGRSRKYVLALVPNRMCYWYWLWRMQRSGHGNWPFGKEMPMADLSAAFESAGLKFLGHWFGGREWAEFFVKDLAGLDESLRDEILAVHRSGIIPDSQRAYLVAALGCKGNATAAAPAAWIPSHGANEFVQNEMTASLADALALAVGAEHRAGQADRRNQQAEASLTQKARELASLRESHELVQKELQRRSDEIARLCGNLADWEQMWANVTRSRGYRMLRVLWRVRSSIVPPGSRRARWIGGTVRALRRAARDCLRAPATAACWVAKHLRSGSKLAPPGTLRRRCAQAVLHEAKNLQAPAAADPDLDLDRILCDNPDRKGIVVYPPFIDWGWMRQRPHQLMAEFARAGYLSLFCSPRRRTDSFQGFHRIDERLYLCDALEKVLDVTDPILLLGWTGHLETAKRFQSPIVIYDYLDNLGVSSHGGVPDRHKLDAHHQLVATSAVVLATARQLYDEVKTHRPDALYCPNGVEYEHFHLASPPAVPADIADLVASGRPIIGYYGALARWFDYGLLAHAARVRPNYQFLLIGPDFDRTLKSSRIAELPNVRWLDEKPYEELPAYLHHFTVATIPFLLNDITLATSPVKLFEYLAAGRPIVTTDMPECRAQPCVLAANDMADFAPKLDEAVLRAASESYRRMADEAARANTWEARTRQIIDPLEASVAQRKKRSA